MLELPDVELVAISSIHLKLTRQALMASSKAIRFANVKLLTDADVRDDTRLTVVPIRKLRSSQDYSAFLFKELVDHVEAPFVLVVQWDGFVVDPAAWTDKFLDYDYIGAPWSHFGDEHVVGNGGFSLRSRKLLDACRDSALKAHGPEDVLICRTHRPYLERVHGIRFAPPDLAGRFSFERTKCEHETFGFHGMFNLVRVFGTPWFAATYPSVETGQIGKRELRDSLVAVLRNGGWRYPNLLWRLFRDWQKARRSARNLTRPGV